jgi:hypothetical protein
MYNAEFRFTGCVFWDEADINFTTLAGLPLFQTKTTGIDNTTEPMIKPPRTIANRQRGGAKIPAIKADSERIRLVNTTLSALAMDTPRTAMRKKG